MKPGGLNVSKYFCYDHRAGLGVALGVLLLLNMAVFMLFTLPARWGAHTFEDALQEAETNATEADQYRDFLRQSAERLDANQAGIDTFYRDVLSTKSDMMTAIMTEIREIATRAEVAYANVGYSFKPVKDEEGLVEFNIALPVEGTYSNLRNFINGVERAESFLALENLSLTSKSIDRFDTIKMTLTLQSFFVDDEGEAFADLPGFEDVTAEEPEETDGAEGAETLPETEAPA